jgi:hypothetical protein
MMLPCHVYPLDAALELAAGRKPFDVQPAAATRAAQAPYARSRVGAVRPPQRVSDGVRRVRRSG